MAKIIGIDVGGSHISAGLFVNGRMTERKYVLLGKVNTRKQFFKKMFMLIDSLYDKKVKKIGIGFPAPVVNGRVFEVHNIPALDNVNVKTEISRKYKVKCKVENDANCFVLAEAKLGAAKGKKNVVGITLGTGIGCGIMINGKLYSGNTGAAGEIGSVPVDGGNLESYTNAKYLKKISKKEPEELSELARKGSKRAKNAWKRYGKSLGIALAFVIDVLDPEIIVLGGKISKGFPYFRKYLMPEIKKHCFRNTASKVKIVKSKYDNSPIVGAALL